MKRVSQLLRETRLAKGYSLEDIYRDTKIQPKVLGLLEGGDWANLPEETYLKGLIRNYGEYLGLDREHLQALFRREYRKKEEIEKPLWPKLPFSFSFSPNFLLILGTVALLILMFAYLGFQYFSQAFGPQLSIASPREGMVVDTGFLTVQGRTDPDAQVYVNGGKIDVSGDGRFSSQLTISQKVTTIEILAQNKFGREKKETRTVHTR